MYSSYNDIIPLYTILIPLYTILREGSTVECSIMIILPLPAFITVGTLNHREVYTLS